MSQNAQITINIVWFFVIAFGLPFAFWMGKRRGREDENQRCSGLCHQAMAQRNSGTLSWVWNAIVDEAIPRKLLDEKTFFGETLREKKLREAREFQERRLKTKAPDIINEALTEQCTCGGMNHEHACETWCGIFVLPKWP